MASLAAATLAVGHHPRPFQTARRSRAAPRHIPRAAQPPTGGRDESDAVPPPQPAPPPGGAGGPLPPSLSSQAVSMSASSEQSDGDQRYDAAAAVGKWAEQYRAQQQVRGALVTAADANPLCSLPGTCWNAASGPAAHQTSVLCLPPHYAAGLFLWRRQQQREQCQQQQQRRRRRLRFRRPTAATAVPAAPDDAFQNEDAHRERSVADL